MQISRKNTDQTNNEGAEVFGKLLYDEPSGVLSNMILPSLRKRQAQDKAGIRANLKERIRNKSGPRPAHVTIGAHVGKNGENRRFTHVCERVGEAGKTCEETAYWLLSDCDLRGDS
ncbi:unnamed protein product [Leptosia nina]|uniref:Uncharacterized protein n=1 Tax=Leptosia nina TaxID=320188 RepID=A0AAV1J705_9NEOP